MKSQNTDPHDIEMTPSYYHTRYCRVHQTLKIEQKTQCYFHKDLFTFPNRKNFCSNSY